MQIYTMLKRLIVKGNYDKADMLNKLDTYFLMGRLTDSEYAELMGIVNPPVEEAPETPVEGKPDTNPEDVPVTIPI